MQSSRLRRVPHLFVLWLTMCVVASPHVLLQARAQTPATAPRPGPAPTTAPQPSPSQRDATRPPGTEQRLPAPSGARPVTQDPTAPPGTDRPAPQAPPSATGAPQPGTATPPASPISPTSPTPSATDPQGAQPSTPGATPATGGEQLREPLFTSLQARPLPPLPDLTRLGVTSDNTLPLSLNEAIRRALENNNEIEFARNDVRYAETLLRGFESVYDPVFSITPQIDNRVIPIASTLGGSNESGTLTTTNLDLNPSVTKLFGRSGGQYQFFFNNQRETTSSTFSQLSPNYSSNLGVQFTQPLWRNRSIDRYRRDIRIQRKRLEQSDLDFRRLTIETIAQVQRAYWDLVFALRDQGNRKENLDLTREQFRQTEARVAAGATAPLERAEVQTELANREADLLVAVQNVSIAENNLKQLILRDPLAREWSASFTPTDIPTYDPKPMNLTDALTEARANRPELSRLRLQQDISNIDLQFFRNQARPRIDIVSTLSSTGLAGTPVVATGTITGSQDIPADIPSGQVPLIFGNPGTSSSAFLLAQINQLRVAQGLTAADVPLITPQTRTINERLVGGYGRTVRNVFGFDTRNIVVGVAIEIPFRNRAAQAQLAGALVQQNQLAATTRTQEQAIEVEVRNAAQSVETARRRVLTARQARENAELQLAGERRLNEVGRSTTYFLFQRQNQLANARNLELRAETDYNKALADMQRATSTTLRANNVIVEAPTGR